MHVVCANIFGANVLKSRFKIDVVIMIICSIVIIINSVLTLPNQIKKICVHNIPEGGDRSGASKAGGSRLSAD